jgi:hypothetical protein
MAYWPAQRERILEQFKVIVIGASHRRVNALEPADPATDPSNAHLISWSSKNEFADGATATEAERRLSGDAHNEWG